MNDISGSHSIHLELRLDGAAPTGHASLEGGSLHPFSGWVGLVRVVEELLTEDSVTSPA
jgi:hypothetical protein